MARNRMIKPQFWEDIKVANLTRDARLLYIGIWNFCDDLGVIPAAELYIKSKVFPYDPIEISEFKTWLDQLEKKGFIQIFTYRSEMFFILPKFLKHQKIDKPNHRDLFVPKEISMTVREKFDDESAMNQESFDDVSTIVQRHVEDESTVKKRKREGKKSKVKKKENKGTFVPPSLEEVKKYFKEKGYKESVAIRAFDSYNENNWHDSHNNPVLNWKQKMINVWFKEENLITNQHGTTAKRNSTNSGTPFIPTDEFGVL